MRFASSLAALVAVALVSFQSSCGGSHDWDGAAPRFLLTRDNRLLERSGERERVLVKFDAGSFVRDPSVSPDGKRLAFTLQLPSRTSRGDGAPDFGADLYVARRDGKDQQLVLRHRAPGEFIQTPAWLPDGKQLAYSVLGQDESGADTRIESVDLSTGKARRFIDDAFGPVSSPDGRTLAYVSVAAAVEQPMLYDLESGRSAPLPGYDRALVLFYSIAWSPDGEKIAFAAADPSVALGAYTGRFAATLHPFLQDIWLMNRDGTDLRRLLELAEIQPSLAWSVDSQAVYVLSKSGFWRLDAASGTKQMIGPGSEGGQVAPLSAP